MRFRHTVSLLHNLSSNPLTTLTSHHNIIQPAWISTDINILGFFIPANHLTNGVENFKFIKGSEGFGELDGEGCGCWVGEDAGRFNYKHLAGLIAKKQHEPLFSIC